MISGLIKAKVSVISWLGWKRLPRPCYWKLCIARTTYRLVNYLLADNQLICRLCWFPKLAVGSQPMRRQIVSTMCNSWKVFPTSALSHWLLWDETISPPPPNFCVGNIAKSVTSEGNSVLLTNVQQGLRLERRLMNFHLQNFQLKSTPLIVDPVGTLS